jgi:transglutaminase-like putative cysteine protease
MRFGLIHRVMTDALAVLGLLALFTSHVLVPWAIVAFATATVLALLVRERWLDSPSIRRLVPAALLLLPVIQGIRLFLGASPLPVFVEFAAVLQVLRLATRRGAAHDQQIIALALLHLIAASHLSAGLAYAACFVAFLVVAPGALVLSHLRREVEGNYRQGARDRTGLPVDVPRILRSRRVIGRPFLLITCLLSIPIFLFTATLFVLFPRVGLSLMLLRQQSPERMIGFSDRVDLGGVGKLRSDPTLAMRVEYPNLPPDPPARLALYLRGTAFDRYDGRSWSRTHSYRRAAEAQGPVVPIYRYPNPAVDRSLAIDLEPIDPPVLFLPPDAVALQVLSTGSPLLGRYPRILAGPEGQLLYATPDDHGLRYEVFLARTDDPPATLLAPQERLRYLALPPGLPPRVSELARRWTRDLADPREQATAIETHLKQDYVYDLDSPSGAAKNPLDHFLFDSKHGHCEFYSTAMAVLLRTLGVPTRSVTGFIGGTYNRFGRYYAVRQGDAHSWVEVHLGPQGWVRFDPTPAATLAPQSRISTAFGFVRDIVEAVAQRWNRHVRGYDIKQQLDLLQSVRSHVPAKSALVRVFGSPRRALVSSLAFALVLSAAVYLARRRLARAGPSAPTTPEHLAQMEIVALYQQLEQSMASRGVPRLPSTPPYAHAVALSNVGHPTAPEVRALTDLYLEVRFGGRQLTDDQRQDFARRVKELRRAAPTRRAA